VKTFSISVKWQDRKLGPSGVVKRVQGGNFSTAIGRALRETYKDMTRAQRFDAGQSGVTVEARRVQE
jgi:hypothetical protein